MMLGLLIKLSTVLQWQCNFLVFGVNTKCQIGLSGCTVDDMVLDVLSKVSKLF